MQLINKLFYPLCMLIIILSIWIGNSHKTQLNDKLDLLIVNTNNEQVDSLQLEIMALGAELDSMKLKYDYDY